MYCKKCGSEVPEGNRFCPNCGEEVSAAPIESGEEATAAPVENGGLLRGLTGGLAVSFLGLLTFFGAFLYVFQLDFREYGYPDTGDEWAAYIGTCVFLLGALILLIAALSRAGTGRLIIGSAVSFLGLLTFFGALLYEIQRSYIEYGYPDTGEDWAGYIGVCVFLLGALILLIAALSRAGTGRLIIGSAVSFLGLLTFFGALLYNYQLAIGEYGFPQAGEVRALYIATCVFLLGGLVLVVSVLSRLGRQRC